MVWCYSYLTVTVGCCPKACYPDHWPSWGWPHLSPNSATGNPKRSWSPHIVPPYVLWRGPNFSSGSQWKVGALTLFHRMYYGEAPELLCQLLPEHLQLDPRLRRSVRSHDLAVQIPRSNQVSHKRSFVPSAARIWNSLPEYIPSLEKRACFKKEVNRYLGDS